MFLYGSLVKIHLFMLSMKLRDVSNRVPLHKSKAAGRFRPAASAKGLFRKG